MIFLNDRLMRYFRDNSITPTAESYLITQEDESDEETIAYWDSDLLGDMPSIDFLMSIQPLDYSKKSQIESDFNLFLAQKDIDSIGEASALLNSTNVTWKNEAVHAIELWDLTWQAFYNDNPLPELVWE
jgi:hypothetical protein